MKRKQFLSIMMVATLAFGPALSAQAAGEIPAVVSEERAETEEETKDACEIAKAEDVKEDTAEEQEEALKEEKTEEKADEKVEDKTDTKSEEKEDNNSAEQEETTGEEPGDGSETLKETEEVGVGAEAEGEKTEDQQAPNQKGEEEKINGTKKNETGETEAEDGEAAGEAGTQLETEEASDEKSEEAAIVEPVLSIVQIFQKVLAGIVEKAQVVKEDGSEFAMFKADPDATKAEKKNGSIVITFVTANTSYDKIYMGNAGDADKDPSKIITGTLADGKYTFIITVPESAENTSVPVALGKPDGSYYTKAALALNVPTVKETEPDPEPEPEPSEATYDKVQVVKEDGNEFAMFTSIEGESKAVKNGENIDVTFATTKTNYTKIHLGEIGDEDKDANTVSGETRAEGGYTFTITLPASAQNTKLPVVLGKADGSFYTKAQLYLTVPTAEEPTPDPEPEPEPEEGVDVSTFADGEYTAKAETGEAMFKVVDAVLNIKDGKGTATITLSGTGYDYLFMGTGADAAKAEDGQKIVSIGTKAYTDDKGNAKTGAQYVIPVQKLDAPIAVAAHSKSKDTWYDRQITFVSSSVEKVKFVPEDGEYTTTAETGEAMFKVVDVQMTVKDGKSTALITLSGTGYDYLFLGKGADAAAAADEQKIASIGTKDYTDDKGNAKTGAQYEIPVAAYDEPIAVAAHSKAKNVWYDRQITFSSENLKKVSPDPEPQPEPQPEPTPEPTPEEESKHEEDLSGATSAVDNQTILVDGVYAPDSFSYSGGTGKVTISCTQISVKNGQAYATIKFSSDKYTYVKASGNKYDGAGTFTIPVELNKNNRIIACTTAMSTPHEVEYVLFIGLAAAQGSGSAAGLLSGDTEKMDEKAPTILGMEYIDEVEVKDAKNFKIFHYEQNVTLLEINVAAGTIREDKEGKEMTEDEKKAEQDKLDKLYEEYGLTPAEKEQANMYAGKVIRYLIVPEDVEITAGLDKELIVIRKPVKSIYTDNEASMTILEKLGKLDLITLSGIEEKDVKNEAVKKAYADKKITFGGATDELDKKALVKAKCDLAILDPKILPNDEKKQDEDFAKMMDTVVNLTLLSTPVFIDKSDAEETDAAKAEWEKVYGELFDCVDAANALLK